MTSEEIEEVVAGLRPRLLPAQVARRHATGSRPIDYEIRNAVTSALHRRDQQWTELVDRLVAALLEQRQ